MTYLQHQRARPEVVLLRAFRCTAYILAGILACLTVWIWGPILWAADLWKGDE